MNVRLDLKLDSKLNGNLKVNLIFELRKYNLNYQFKYLKSVAESGGIVITVST